MEAIGTTITRPALRYHGGKWGIKGSMADWIISQMPPHEHYVEPFAGGASVLIRKAPSTLETYNDLDLAVVSFFRVLRERPNDLIDMILLTPWSRYELEACRWPVPPDCKDPELELARRVYARSHMGRGKTTMQNSSGWRYEIHAHRGTRPASDFRMVDHLRQIAFRLRQVQIECDDALRVIERFDTAGTLFYIDPPYMQETRSRRWMNDAYGHEMDHEAHERLCRKLGQVNGMVLLSGYWSELYERLEREGWRRSERECVHTDGRGATRPTRTECVWMNPAAQQAQAQMELF